jgi:HEAT repeat protein
MGKLSAHGVKQVLNPILASLPEETQWKSRQESIRLLGSMAHLSPKSLATSLPQIIPRLVEAGSDPHPKVKESARHALVDISSVIKNPEVAELSPVLMEAIADPANKTKHALEMLLSCEFMHSIDAPSLALLVPVLARALKDRSADLKRKSSAIMGNITSMLSEPKIICPYLAQILPGLKNSLLDPIPDVRTMSAKALGSLVGGVGEEECVDLLPWLLETLKMESSPVERSGAAQGLAEVALVLGRPRVKAILDEAIAYRSSAKSASREGLFWLLTFLPAVLNEAFAEYIPYTLPVILVGFSDSNESVREVALRAGRIMVQTMGAHHGLDLLPALRGGLFDEESNIRHSSVSLLGELLYLVGDTKAVGMADNEDEDESGLENVTRVAHNIKMAFGENNTHLVLAALYTVRSDTTMGVRQTSLQVWKSVVNNTPRTLVEIMPVLVNMVVSNLSSHVDELRVMCSRCLGDIVKKLGNKVLAVLVPCLRKGLEEGDASTRQGICLGLAEIFSCLTRPQVEAHMDSLVPSLQQALCDIDPNVRGQAANAFQTLARCIGPRAIDEIVPALVERLAGEDEASERALLGLKEVVQLKPRDLLEYLLPKLLKSPIDLVASKALATIAQVTGQYLHYHFQLIVPSLTSELTLANKEGGDRLEAVRTCSAAVMGAAATTGVNFLLIELGKQIENDSDPNKRRWGCWLTEQFLLNTTADYSDYVGVLLKYLLARVADRDRDVLASLLGALMAMGSAFPIEQYTEHIDFISSCISSAASDARFRTAASIHVSSSGDYILPLFTLPKSLEAFTPMLLFALTNGSTQSRESAANVLGEMVLMCDADVLKPFLIKVTGPLIRVVGDRFPSSVKAAILETLCILLDRGGANLKAFAPQLQTTFVKSLNDPTKQVRVAASNALNKLIVLSLTPRVDPLLTELAAVVTQTDSTAIKASIIDALANVLRFSGSKASPGVLHDRVEPVIVLHLDDEDEAVRTAAVSCLGSAAPSLALDRLTDLVNGLLSKRVDSSSMLIGRVMGASSVLCSMETVDPGMRNRVFDSIHSCFSHEDYVVRNAANGYVEPYCSFSF